MPFKHILTFLTALILAPCLRATTPVLPSIPTNIFLVTDYGAIGDRAADDSAGIQKAINAANAAGGGIVYVPPGIYLSGPITLLSRINLQLAPGAVLRMLPLGQYPGGTTRAPTFITCNDVHDLEISGHGTIDGQGGAWWAAFRTNPRLVRPMMLNLFSVNRLFIHDVTFTDPPYHHCGVRKDSSDITISNLTVNTDPRSPNTDGLNLAGAHVLVRDCHITDGDDNIALASSGKLSDVLITNCVFGYGHGVSIGSDVRHGVDGLTVAHCSFDGGTFGLRMKADNESGGLARNLFYHDISMKNVEMPILIYSYYRLAGGANKISRYTPAQVAAMAPQPVRPTTPVWRDITFSNITASATVAGGAIWGMPNMAVSNVNFVNVNITAPGSFNIFNAQGIRFQDCTIRLSGGQSFTTFNADVVVTNTPGHFNSSRANDKFRFTH